MPKKDIDPLDCEHDEVFQMPPIKTYQLEVSPIGYIDKLEAENTELKEELEVCRDANTKLKKKLKEMK